MAQMTIVLPGERSPSQNEYYSSKHWRKRNEIAKRVHETVQMRLRELGIGPGETCNNRVSITVIGYFDNHPLDSSNVAGKLYEDALKGWLIEDDSIKHVKAMTTISEVDKIKPRVEIILTEVL